MSDLYDGLVLAAESFGISEREFRAYVPLCRRYPRGTTGASVGRLAGLGRTNAYGALNGLQNKGLVCSRREFSSTFYYAEPINAFQELVIKQFCELQASWDVIQEFFQKDGHAKIAENSLFFSNDDEDVNTYRSLLAVPAGSTRLMTVAPIYVWEKPKRDAITTTS